MVKKMKGKEFSIEAKAMMARPIVQNTLFDHNVVKFESRFCPNGCANCDKMMGNGFPYCWDCMNGSRFKYKRNYKGDIVVLD